MKNRKENILGITSKKENNFSAWYLDLIKKSELIEYYSIPGCFTLRPKSFFIWNTIKKFFTHLIEQDDVKEYSFPLLLREESIQKEKDLIKNFAPELAWVTRFGKEELKDQYAIRPTSETIIYEFFSKWIKTYRDLPLKTNQWCNVFRAEITQTIPFIRSKEFLWQEGHSAFLTKEEAEEDTKKILIYYEKVYKELLAVPTVLGKKTESEKFGGADYTLTTEIYIPMSSKAIQGATSHFLGQNFSKVFDISAENNDNKKVNPYQNSWGITTRSIGITVMIHSDNKGLILPPNVAINQIVIVPCGKISSDEESSILFEKIEYFESNLKKHGLRVIKDIRTNYTPGYKFNYYELLGVPLRINLGERDFTKKICEIVRRDNGEKIILEINESLPKKLNEILEDIQNSLYKKAKENLNSNLKLCDSFKKFLNLLNDGCIVMGEFCGLETCEDDVKEKSTEKIADKVVKMGAKPLCIPFDYQKLVNNKCFNCGKDSINVTLFGRSY